MAVIARTRHLEAVRRLLARYPVVAILGARQVGKTTLARSRTGPDRSARTGSVRVRAFVLASRRFKCVRTVMPMAAAMPSEDNPISRWRSTVRSARVRR